MSGAETTVAAFMAALKTDLMDSFTYTHPDGAQGSVSLGGVYRLIYPIRWDEFARRIRFPAVAIVNTGGARLNPHTTAIFEGRTLDLIIAVTEFRDPLGEMAAQHIEAICDALTDRYGSKTDLGLHFVDEGEAEGEAVEGAQHLFATVQHYSYRLRRS